MIMTNLVFLPKNTQDFCFVHASFSSNKMNCTMHFCFHFYPFVSLLNFFSINSLFISHLFSLTCRYQNNEHENDFANGLGLDFERVIYAGEFNNNEGMKDDNLSPDLLRLVAQDEKQILPHQKAMEAINLGSKEEKRKVKIETTLSLPPEKIW